MLRALSRLVIKGRWVFAFAWILVAVGLSSTAPNLQEEANESLMASGSQSTAESVQARERIADAFPETTERMNNQVTITLFREEGLTDADRDYAADLVEFVDDHGDEVRLESIASPFSDDAPMPALISDDERAALVVLDLDTALAAHDSAAWLEQVREVIPTLRGYLTDPAQAGAPEPPAGLDVHLTGANAIQQEVIELQEASLTTTLVMTLAFILVVLLIVYRSPVAVIFPIVGVVLALTISQGVLGFAADAGFAVSPNALVFLIIVLFGAGTDYCLLMLQRFRENLLQGQTKLEALGNALPRVAEAVLSSALAVVVAFGCMLFAQDFNFRAVGPPLAVAVVVAVLVIMTFVPAVLALLGERVFWPFLPSKVLARQAAAAATTEPVAARPSGWERLASSVVRRPVRYIVIVVVALLPFLGLLTRFTYDNNELRALLPTSADAYEGLEVVRENFGEGAGAENAVQVVVETEDDLWEPGSLEALEEVADSVAQVPGVDAVTTATRPAGDVLTEERLLALAAGDDEPSSGSDGPSIFATSDDVVDQVPALRPVMEQFISQDGNSAVLSVTLETDPYAEESFGTVAEIREALADGLAAGALDGSVAYAGGTTAEVVDNLDNQREDFLFIIVVVLIAITLILMALLRSVVAPLYMVATIALSFAATMGLTYGVFHYVLGYEGLWFDVPVVGFVILVALGIDYSIFLMSRVQEEHHGGRTTREAVRVGLARTGSIITSCGIIMAGTFTPLILSGITTFVEMGVAIVVGLLLDTFVIRTLLVPAIAAKLGDANWWPRRVPKPAAPTPDDSGATEAPVITPERIHS